MFVQDGPGPLPLDLARCDIGYGFRMRNGRPRHAHSVRSAGALTGGAGVLGCLVWVEPSSNPHLLAGPPSQSHLRANFHVAFFFYSMTSNQSAI